MAERMSGLGAGLAMGALVLLGTATPAPAQDKPPPGAPAIVRTITWEAFAGMLRTRGYRAEVKSRTDGPGTSHVETGMAGRRVVVRLLNCEGEACGSVQYRLIFNKESRLTVDVANGWNLRRRYAKAHVVPDGRLILEWDLNLAPGVTAEALTASIETFQELVGLFDQYLRERGAPQAPARNVERRA